MGGGMLVEVKAGPLRVRISQEEASNSPEYVETVMRMAAEQLMWVQRETYALDAGDGLDEAAKERIREKVMATLAEDDWQAEDLDGLEPPEAV